MIHAIINGIVYRNQTAKEVVLLIQPEYVGKVFEVELTPHSRAFRGISFYQPFWRETGSPMRGTKKEWKSPFYVQTYPPTHKKVPA